MYATRQQMEDAYGADQIALLSTRDVEVDEDSITRALSDASALIDTYLSGRYKLPLAATAPVLVRPCVDIACYYLAQQATMLTDELRQRYEDAVKLLRDFAEGRATLSLDTDDDGKAESGPQVISVSGPPRLFSRETMRDIG